MSASAKATDWQCVGIANVGGASGPGGIVSMYQFRSKQADFLGEYIFIGGGIGFGGSLGGGMAPSPSDVINNRTDYWTSLKCSRAFSSDDLNNCYGHVSSIGAAFAYGFNIVYATAGLVDVLFSGQPVGGWGTGFDITGSVMHGMWKRLSVKNF